MGISLSILSSLNDNENTFNEVEAITVEDSQKPIRLFYLLKTELLSNPFTQETINAGITCGDSLLNLPFLIDLKELIFGTTKISLPYHDSLIVETIQGDLFIAHKPGGTKFNKISNFNEGLLLSSFHNDQNVGRTFLVGKFRPRKLVTVDDLYRSVLNYPKNYNLFSNNCQHFCESMLSKFTKKNCAKRKKEKKMEEIKVKNVKKYDVIVEDSVIKSEKVKKIIVESNEEYQKVTTRSTLSSMSTDHEDNKNEETISGGKKIIVIDAAEENDDVNTNSIILF